MGKQRRARLARGLNHVLSFETKIHTALFHEKEWLQDSLKASIRVAKEVQRVLDLYEEDFQADIRAAVQAALDERFGEDNADDQPVGSQGAEEEAA